MSFLPELWHSLKKLILILVFISVIATGGWIAYLYDISQKPQVAEKLLIVEGENALNIGNYLDAQRIFEDELKANPKNKEAIIGLSVATIRQKFSQPEFKEALDTLYQRDPANAHINLFLGEFYAANKQDDKALLHYEQAIALNPRLAEAHLALSRLYLQQDNYESAKIESLNAIDSASLPKYRNNLGSIYFKQKHYEEAIKEYGKNKEYPLSALEAAKIYWRLDYLSQAASYQNLAIEWLNDRMIMSKPENKSPWTFEIAPEKKLDLFTVEEKKNYAHYSLSVSFYLQGDKTGSENEIKKIKSIPLTHQNKIITLLTTDLDLLALANINLTEKINAYKKQYLENLAL
jgi:tetratricopeptide (TPR) repeat protein